MSTDAREKARQIAAQQAKKSPSRQAAAGSSSAYSPWSSSS